MQKAMWVFMAILVVIVGYYTFTSPQWANISVLQMLLRG